MLDVLGIDTAYTTWVQVYLAENNWCLACLDLVHGFIDLNDRRREGINGGIWRGCL